MEKQMANRTVRMSGKLTKEDYKHFVPEVERLITSHGKIRILCQMHDFHGWRLAALWEYIKFDAKHFGHIERVAFVGERRWQHGMAAFCKPFTKAKVRYFDEHQSEEAQEWIWADMPIAVARGTRHMSSPGKARPGARSIRGIVSRKRFSGLLKTPKRVVMQPAQCERATGGGPCWNFIMMDRL